MSDTAVTAAPIAFRIWISAEPIAPVPPFTSTSWPPPTLAFAMSESA